VITALPGPRVGPIPATGLISGWQDAYLLLFLVTLAAAARLPGTTDRGEADVDDLPHEFLRFPHPSGLAQGPDQRLGHDAEHGGR
jgi:hypothetical protein